MSDKLEEKIITIHFSEPETKEEQEALRILIGCLGVKYRKTVWRTKKVTEWYAKAKNAIG